MRSSSKSGSPCLLLLVVGVSVDCASAPPPPPAAPPPVAAAPAPPIAPRAPQAHPAKVVATIAVAHPAASYRALETYVGTMPEWQKASLTMGFLGVTFDRLVDVDHPAFMAIGADERVAVALGVVPGQEAKLAGRLDLERSESGEYWPPAEATPTTKKKAFFACAIVNGVRTTLVCAEKPDAVRDFAPFLSKMTLEGGAPDLRFEIAGDYLREQTEKNAEEKRKKERTTRAYRAGEDLGKTLVDGVMNDLDALVMDASLSPDVAATLRFRFRTDASPITHALTAHPDRSAPATSAFWSLPADASMAFFSSGGDAADLAGARSVLVGGFEDALKAEVCAPLLAYLDQRIRPLLFTGGPFVLGVGMDEVGGAKALKAFHDLKTRTPAARVKARQAGTAWLLMEVDEPSTNWTDVVRDLAVVDEKFAGCKPTPSAATNGAGAPASTPPEPPSEDSKYEITPVLESAHLPRGTVHLTDHVQPTKEAPEGTAPAHATHVFVVPDGGRTWFAIGENEALVVAKVKTALSNAPGARTLASRHDLDALHAPAAGVGFVTTAGVRMMGAKDVTEAELLEQYATVNELAALPSKGETPFLISWRNPPQEVAVQVVVPAAGVREILEMLRKKDGK